MANKSTYDLMLSYSPIDNVNQQPYPNMLAIGGKLPAPILMPSCVASLTQA